MMRRAGWVAFLSLLLGGCGSAARPPEPRRVDQTGFTSSDGEAQLEATLHELDLIDAKIYPFQDAGRDLIALCTTRNRDVMVKKLAFKLILGKPPADDKATEMSYYVLLQEGSPPELLPIVLLRKYYKEGLLRCLLDVTGGKSPEASENSDISILTALNFEDETSTGVVIVDFMTHWCGPCKEMVPDLEKLAKDYKGKLKVGRLDVDRNRMLSEQFDVKKFPTLILLKNGKEVSRLETRSSYTELQTWAQHALQEEKVPPEHVRR